MPIVLHKVGPRLKVPAAVAAGTDGYHRYRLQQQLVPLAWTDGPFSSSAPSPKYEYKEAPSEHEDSYEDYLCDLEDIVPGVQYDVEIDLYSSKHVMNNISWTPNCGKDLAKIKG